MSSSMASSPQIQNGIQFAPLRSLDDFVLGSARFQLPQFNDLEKWGNRVTKNLLYYQTNYIILFATIYLLMAILYPTKIFCGIFVKSIILCILMYFFADTKYNMDIKNPYHKWYYLVATIIIGYLLLVWYDAIFLSALTLFLAFLGTFVHSSLRLRNIKNKVVNMKETLFETPTPMGMFLNAMNIRVDNLLN